jgi:archaemetzincin
MRPRTRSLFLVFVAFAGMLAACNPAGPPAPGSNPREDARAHAPTASAPPTQTACLLPLGAPDQRLLAPIAHAIEHSFGFRVRQLDTQALPKSAWYAPRSRYRADRLLDFLQAQRAPRGCDFLLGFTQADVSTTKGEVADWGVLGLSYLQQRVSVVSTFRMRRNASPDLIMRRAVKVSLHELGHAIGLPHRNDGPECLMNDAGGAVASIDRANGLLCDSERRIAEAYLHRQLPDLAAPPWEK